MMIDEQITLYPELSDEERAAVEAYVVEHPEWRSALEEAKEWDRVLHDVRRLGRETPDEALAYYVVTRRLQPNRVPPEVAKEIQRVEDRVSTDEKLAARLRTIEARLAEFKSPESPDEQFERLRSRKASLKDSGSSKDGHSEWAAVSGGTMAALPERAEERRATGAKPRRDSAANVRVTSSRAEERRSAGPKKRRAAGLWRRLLLVAVAFIALYGALFAGSRLLRPSSERLAAFEQDELVLEGYESVRGSSVAREDVPNAAIRHYLVALDHLRNAETAVLGLFPTFDEARLDAAAAHLREVLHAQPERSFLSSEASFLLGKTELARGNEQAATAALHQVVQDGGRRAPEARGILEKLAD